MIVSSESIPSQTWPTTLQDLSLKIHDYEFDDKIIESHPLNEGFILFNDNPKKPATQSKLVRPTVQNISCTTCTTIVMVKTTTAKNSTALSVGHRGRRLLNEPRYDTDMDTTSKETPLEDDGEIDRVLKLNDEELSRQLMVTGFTIDASGESMLEKKKIFGETSLIFLHSHGRNNRKYI